MSNEDSEPPWRRRKVVAAEEAAQKLHSRLQHQLYHIQGQLDKDDHDVATATVSAAYQPSCPPQLEASAVAAAMERWQMMQVQQRQEVMETLLQGQEQAQMQEQPQEPPQEQEQGESQEQAREQAAASAAGEAVSAASAAGEACLAEWMRAQAEGSSRPTMQEQEQQQQQPQAQAQASKRPTRQEVPRARGGEQRAMAHGAGGCTAVG